MSVSVSTIPPERAREYWPYVAPNIERALEYGWNTPLEVLALIENAQAQCWIAVDEGKLIGVWVTRIEQSGVGRFCLVWLAGGERVSEWIPLVQEHTESWARENGCSEMQIIGRKGWAKRLPDYKWTAIVLKKEL